MRALQRRLPLFTKSDDLMDIAPTRRDLEVDHQRTLDRGTRRRLSASGRTRADASMSGLAALEEGPLCVDRCYLRTLRYTNRSIDVWPRRAQAEILRVWARSRRSVEAVAVADASLLADDSPDDRTLHESWTLTAYLSRRRVPWAQVGTNTNSPESAS